MEGRQCNLKCLGKLGINGSRTDSADVVRQSGLSRETNLRHMLLGLPEASKARRSMLLKRSGKSFLIALINTRAACWLPTEGQRRICIRVCETM